MTIYYLSIPTDPVRYFTLTTGGSPDPTLVEVEAPVSSILLPSTQQAGTPSEAPYLMLPADYINLFTSQYQGSTKLLAWNLGYLEMLADVTGNLQSIMTMLDFDNILLNFYNQAGRLLLEDGGVLLTEDGDSLILLDKLNPLLDCIGEIVGLPRQVDFQPSGGVSPIMDNETYLVALKARIGANQWDGTHDSLQVLWKNIFPTGSIKITDNQNMTISVNAIGTFSSMINDLISHGYIVPRPEGVLTSVEVPAFPLFGFGMEDAYVSGFGVGEWG